MAETGTLPNVSHTHTHTDLNLHLWYCFLIVINLKPTGLETPPPSLFSFGLFFPEIDWKCIFLFWPESRQQRLRKLDSDWLLEEQADGGPSGPKEFRANSNPDWTSPPTHTLFISPGWWRSPFIPLTNDYWSMRVKRDPPSTHTPPPSLFWTVWNLAVGEQPSVQQSSRSPTEMRWKAAKDQSPTVLITSDQQLEVSTSGSVTSCLHRRFEATSSSLLCSF